MFNLRRKKIAIDFAQPTKANLIPGATVEEKAAYISELLTEKLADDFKSGRITEEQVYQLVSDKEIEAKEAKKREQEDLSKTIDDKFQSDLK